MGSASRIAAPELDVAVCLEPLACGLQHRRRTVDADDARHERRECGADLAGAASQIADDRVRIRECRQRCELKAIAEQLVAHPIPLSGGGCEELGRFRSPRCNRGLQTPLILQCGGRGAHLLAHERPEPSRCAVHRRARHRVDVARTLSTDADPTGIGQRFQMTADSRLRQLHHGTQLGHAQLLAIEEQEDAAARAVRE
ncbi:MAG: hypothetical protein QM736_25895 [Vicinamibacterales bacterium]